MNSKKDLLLLFITSLILYQLYIAFYSMVNKSEAPIPILYEGYSGDDDSLNDRIKMIEEIKQFIIFREKTSDNQINKKIKTINDVINAPIYTGKLKLVGVLKHAGESKSIVILEFDGMQKTYFINDRVAVNKSAVTIIKILIDRIIINENESYYSLNI
ncbi:type II secretion system protein N [Yersinia pekkanenii]|nr:type II secretion system protein N [Yersinia pekkanenii]